MTITFCIDSSSITQNSRIYRFTMLIFLYVNAEFCFIIPQWHSWFPLRRGGGSRFEFSSGAFSRKTQRLTKR